MTAMKITRRIIDPITFVERVGIEFIPRIEDSVLDDQLAGSMSYAPPKNSSVSSRAPVPPPPPPPSESPPAFSPEAIRPPTPPKQRGKGNPNSPRNSIKSPGAGSQKPKLKSSMKLSTHLQQGRSKRSSLTLAQIGEENDDGDDDEGEGNLSEGSMSHMSALQPSITKMEQVEVKAKTTKVVRFADENELNEISRLRNSVIAEMFWASEDLANFRYEAFMEEAGLDINEFG